MGKTKLYFESVNDEFCKPLAEFIKEAKELGLESIKLIEAVEDKETKDVIWCSHYGCIEEIFLCKKSECDSYSSKSGRGVCENRGKLYNHGEEVLFNLKA